MENGNDFAAIARRTRVVAALTAVIVILLLWALFAANVFFGFHLGAANDAPAEDYRLIYLCLAVAGTVFLPGVAWYKIRQSSMLAAKGTQGMARVVSIGGVAVEGITPVTFAYDFGGLQYTKKIDIPCGDAERFTDQTQVPIVYDPQDPRNCRILWSRAQNISEANTAGLASAVWHLRKIIGVVVLFGATIGAALIARVLGAGSDDIRGYSPSLLAGGLLAAILVDIALDRWRHRNAPGAWSFRWQYIAAGVVLVVLIGSLIWIPMSRHAENESARAAAAAQAQQRSIEQSPDVQAGVEAMRRLATRPHAPKTAP